MVIVAFFLTGSGAAFTLSRDSRWMAGAAKLVLLGVPILLSPRSGSGR